MALVNVFRGGKFSSIGAVVVAATKEKIFALTYRKNHNESTQSTNRQVKDVDFLNFARVFTPWYI